MRGDEQGRSYYLHSFFVRTHDPPPITPCATRFESFPLLKVARGVRAVALSEVSLLVLFSCHSSPPSGFPLGRRRYPLAGGVAVVHLVVESAVKRISAKRPRTVLTSAHANHARVRALGIAMKAKATMWAAL